MKAAGTVGLLTLASRILGMIRDIVSAKQFGTTWQWDAFLYAFMFPNFFRRLLGEGALSSAFIPVYSETLHREGKAAAFRFSNVVGTVLAGGLLVFIIILEFVLNALVGWDALPERLHLTIDLLRFLFPYLWFISICALFMGILNCHRHFLTPSLGPVILDIFWIAGVLWVASLIHKAPPEQLRILSLFLLSAGVIQMAVQIPVLMRLGFRFQWVWDLAHEGFRKTGKLLLPAVLGFAVVQINILVDMTLAFVIGPGANSSLWYGTRLMQFPLGVFAIAMGTALLPMISEQTANREFEAAKQTLSFAMRSVFLIILPCSVGLIVLRTPIIQMLFERGAFDAVSTARTSFVLLCYVLGLFAYSGQKLVVAGFYAVQDTKTPVIIGVVALLSNIILNLILMWPMKEAGLALATSISGIIQFALLLKYYNRKISEFPFRAILRSFLKILGASTSMGIVCWAVLNFLRQAVPGDHLTALLIQVFIPILFCITAFIGFCKVFRIHEVRETLEWMKTKKTSSVNPEF
ncbi:MAG: murein biosynthesis integral membrane protein MurJ [Candidatus Omnitrophica bacterium]|nr:murein biosynthesis integral membrane protein MurJ [Candidatus Omnitrophota bacterium]